MFTLSRVPFAKPIITLGFLALALQTTGCVKYGFPTPDQLVDRYAKNIETQKTYSCSLARFHLMFPHKDAQAIAVEQQEMQMMKAGLCAPFSSNYQWYGNTPAGPQDAAWGEPQNAPYRGHPELIDRNLLLRDDFKKQPESQYETMVVPVPTQQQLDAYQKKQATPTKGPAQGSRSPVPTYRSSAPGKYQEKPSRFNAETFVIPNPVKMIRLGPNQN